MSKTTITARAGNALVRTTQDGPKSFLSRLYVNDGETATLQWAGHTTQAGAVRWAERVVAKHVAGLVPSEATVTRHLASLAA